MNPKLRPKLKGPFTIIELFNEVDAILKADGRSHKTIIRHLSKLKKCIGKPFNARESTFNESHLINDASREEDPGRERFQAGRDSSQPSTQLKQVGRSECTTAVDGPCSNNTVTRSFNTKQFDDELNLQSKPSQNQLKRSKSLYKIINKDTTDGVSTGIDANRRR